MPEVDNETWVRDMGVYQGIFKFSSQQYSCWSPNKFHSDSQVSLSTTGMIHSLDICIEPFSALMLDPLDMCTDFLP
jgi:hypothetical protein